MAAGSSICLVASCPGGVASNVVTFLARADVPLSVAMTSVSTLAAIVATPALTKLLVGHLVPIDAGALLLSTLQVLQKTLRSDPVPFQLVGHLVHIDAGALLLSTLQVL